MGKCRKIFDRIFIDGLSSMAQGLFATLIIGTIIQQIGTLIGGSIGDMIFVIGKVAASLTGAGIGIGVAYKFGCSQLVVVSSATAGMVGAFASKFRNAFPVGYVEKDNSISYRCNTVYWKEKRVEISRSLLCIR